MRAAVVLSKSCCAERGSPANNPSCEPASMSWFFLIIAIFAEIIATSALKLTAGFSRFWPTFVTISGYLVAFLFFITVLAHHTHRDCLCCLVRCGDSRHCPDWLVVFPTKTGPGQLCRHRPDCSRRDGFEPVFQNRARLKRTRASAKALALVVFLFIIDAAFYLPLRATICTIE